MELLLIIFNHYWSKILIESNIISEWYDFKHFWSTSVSYVIPEFEYILSNLIGKLSCKSTIWSNTSCSLAKKFQQCIKSKLSCMIRKRIYGRLCEQPTVNSRPVKWKIKIIDKYHIYKWYILYHFLCYSKLKGKKYYHIFILIRCHQKFCFEISMIKNLKCNT